MKLVWKLLRENLSKPQLLGFSLANLIGMTIVLLAIQFYVDINPIFSDNDSLFKKDFLTVTRKVGVVDAISSISNGFTENDIDDLKKQSFVKDVGAFTSSRFSVLAGISNENAGINFKTEMFFESLPDHFLDVKLDNWTFSSSENEIPIILPKNYLDLYNFGFAESNSLPKLSEGLIGLIGLDISLYGKSGTRKQMHGRIVGFSNRINTILVPEAFMTWANTNFGDRGSSNPSRLMIEVSNIADPTLSTYFKENGYEISGDNQTASKMSFFLKIIISIVLLVGLIICILSFFILVLSIYLLLEKNMAKLKTLRLIGYSKSFVIRPYEFLVLFLNSTILLLSISLVLILRTIYLEAISKIYVAVEASFPVSVFLLGFAIFILLLLANITVIRTKIK